MRLFLSSWWRSVRDSSREGKREEWDRRGESEKIGIEEGKEREKIEFYF